ncbi:MAG: helix-turn-helix transcriptional regulator, partial [Gemmatimonadota bacterium]
TTRGERDALRAVKRVCHAGLDTISLRQELARQTASVVPTEATSIVATDPDTGLFVHGWMTGLSDGLVHDYMTQVYPLEITEYFDLARSGRTTSTINSALFLDMLRREGLEQRARTALCWDGGIWASWCMFREPGSPAFGEKEARFLRAAAPHIGYGMRSASLLEAARAADGASTTAPSVLILDVHDRVVLRSGPAAAQLDDLANVGTDPDLLPYAVHSLLSRVRLAHEGVTRPGHPELRAHGRSGRWYTLRASLAEPDASGESATVIVIEPARPPRGSVALMHLYGLTPRERDVVLLVLKGDSTKRIGARLGVSGYTVQDHLSRACEKVGVRGRRALLAKLYRDGYTPAQPA